MERFDGDYRGLTDAIIGAAIEVRRHLGPGLLESTYESCLVFELTQRGFTAEKQKDLPVVYKGIRIDCGYRMDVLVNRVVVLKLKSVDKLQPIHEA